MIKKKKDSDPSGKPETKKERPEQDTEKQEKKQNHAKTCEDHTGKNTGAGAESGEAPDNTGSGTEQPEKADTGDGTGAKKEVTETEFLKMYLEQTMKELKKAKDEKESFQSQIKAAEAQRDKYKDNLEKVVAEYENYRNRTAREKAELGAAATSKAVKTLIPALDNLERAMPFADSNPESFKQGVEMTLRQLSGAFKELGVEEIEAEGAVFDPNLHEAVMHVDDDTLGESVITEVFQKGYRLGEKVIRHSVVKVAN